MQPIATLTIGMGPGRRQNVLEDQWGYSNWRKYVRMRESIHTYLLFLYLSIFSIHTARTLKKRLLLAIEHWSKQQEAFDELTRSITDKAVIRLWKEQVEAWEEDPSLPDPYYVATQGAYMLYLPKYLISNSRCRSHADGNPAKDRRGGVQGERPGRLCRPP